GLGFLALPMEDQGAPFAGHRLAPANQVEDAKPPVPERHRAGEEVPFLVRPPVEQRLGHPANRIRIRRSIESNLAGDAAHQSRASCRSPLEVGGCAGLSLQGLILSAIKYGRLSCDS